MGEDNKISTSNYKKYTTILNEVIEGLSRIQHDLSESLQDGHRVDAKFKAAVVSLKCIDRKYRTLLFDEEPPCIQCTTEYLEGKKKEREQGKEKLQAMRTEYYMQEEHMTKLSHTLQEAEKELAMQSIKCTHEGLLVTRLLWTATKPRSILEKLTAECTTQLHDFLNLAEGCIYAFAATYKHSMPDPCTDEYQYVVSLCGILTNLSSIPEGRLFLMWNPFGRAIYTMGLDMMRAISGKTAGSLKWMILIMIYNILVNPLGRKFILKHPLLCESLEGCLLPPNCADITGTALHIIQIFVDDFIDDNDMVSVLMYQLPLKQVYSLSNTTNDVNLRKIALAIVSRLKKKMLDCRKAVAVGPSTVKRRKPKKFVTTSVMTSNMSVCSEYETEDTQYYTNSETEISNASSRKNKLTSSNVVKPLEGKPYSRKLSKKKPSINVCEEMCATPSLRAKGKKKITIKTLFKPSASKSLNISCVELRARSTGRLEGVPPLKQKSKSAELLSASQNKLMNVDRKTVISMLSKLDLDTYLRPSYDGIGIPLKSNDCPNCCKRTEKAFDRKVSKRTTVPTACACKKTTENKGKCDHLVCVCDEIAARQATRSKVAKQPVKDNKNACLCVNKSEEKGKCDDETQSQQGSKSQGIKKIEGTKEACKSETGEKCKCGQQVCVCEEIATRQAQAQEKQVKEDKKVAEKNYNRRDEQNRPDGTEEICICSEETEKSSKVQIKTVTEIRLHNTPVKSTETKKAEKSPVRFENQECCICSEDANQSNTAKKLEDSACACTNKTGAAGKCGQQVCVCAEIAERHAKAQKGPWTPGRLKERKKSVEENYNTTNVASSNDDDQEKCICSEEIEESFEDKADMVPELYKSPEKKNAQLKSTQTRKAEKSPVQFKSAECCICSEDAKQSNAPRKVGGVNEACACTNKTGETGKCGQQVCVCAEIAKRHAQAQKGPWTPGRGKERKKFVEENYNTTNVPNSNKDAQENCICSEEIEKSLEDKAEMVPQPYLSPERKDAQVKSTQTKKAEKSPVHFKSEECCICSEDANQPNASKKVGDVNEACACTDKTGTTGKCGHQVCVCAEIVARQAQAQKGPWTPRTVKESKAFVEQNYNPTDTLSDAQNTCICSKETEKSFEVKLETVTDVHLCSEEKSTQAKSTKLTKTDKSPVRFENQGDVNELKATKKIHEAGETCECPGEEIENISNKADSAQEICVCSEEKTDEKSKKRDEDVADAYLCPEKKTTETQTKASMKTNKFTKIENHNTCICSEDITHKQHIKTQNAGEACACMNKTAEKGKCNQQLCVCAEIAARQAKAKKGEWMPRMKDNKSTEKETKDKISEPLDEKCICSNKSDKHGEREAMKIPKENAIEIQIEEIAIPKENAIEMETVSFTNLHSSSDRSLSVHSKLVIRKTSGLRRKPKVSYTKAAEDKKLKWEDICSCPAKPKGDRTTCGDECETCMITLPVIDIAALANEPKNKEQQARAVAGGDELVHCGCNPKERKTKPGEENEEKPQSKLETKAETEVNAEDKNQTDRHTVGCPNKCKRKQASVETGEGKDIPGEAKGINV